MKKKDRGKKAYYRHGSEKIRKETKSIAKRLGIKYKGA